MYPADGNGDPGAHEVGRERGGIKDQGECIRESFE